MSDSKEDTNAAAEWMSRTTAVLAVLAALSTGSWGDANLSAILEQGKVNDSWAYYQAKSLKQHIARDSAELARGIHADAACISSLDAEAERLAPEKKKAEDYARAYKTSRDQLVEKSLWFQLSFAAIQLGVVLGTIATGTKKKGLWVASVIFGVLGLFLHANGRWLFYRAPGSWYKTITTDLEGDIK